MSFRIKFYEFVNKPKVVKDLERNCLELVNILNEKQKSLALFVQKLSFVNDVFVLGINNYTLELNTIKIAHHSASKYLRALLNKYYVTSIQMVDAIEDMFKCMSTIEEYKNKLVQYFSLHTDKPIEIRFHLMQNKSYQNELIKLLMLIQRLQNLYYKKTNEAKQLNLYLNNILNIQNKLLSIYKENPYELTTNVNNAKYINGLRKQLEFERKLVSNFNTNDANFEQHFKRIRGLIYKYKQTYDIPPILLNIHDKNFGSYKHLMKLKNIISSAIGRQMHMLNRELNDLNNRDAMKGKYKLEPKIFVQSDPKLVNLLGQQEVVTKQIAHLPGDVKMTIAELEMCLKKSDEDVEHCITAHKMAGGSAKGKNKGKIPVAVKPSPNAIGNVTKLIDYLKFREQLENNNNKIRIALQVLYKMQRDLSKDAEMSEAVRQAEHYEQDLLKKFSEHALAEVKLRHSDDNMDKHMSYLTQLEKYNKQNPLMIGGQDDFIMINKLGNYNEKLIMANEIRKRNHEAYKKIKMQYADYIEKQLAKGSAKSPDALIKDAFYKEIYHLVKQQLKTCTDLPLEEVKGVSDNQLFAVEEHKLDPSKTMMPGMFIGGNDTFPGELESVVADKLYAQDKQWGLFKGLSDKLIALFGPTSEQYDFVQKVINNSLTDHKTELLQRYGYANPVKLENEFLKAEICAAGIKEKMYGHIDLFPNYDTMCQVAATLDFELNYKHACSLLELIAKTVNWTHTQATGWKGVLESASHKLSNEVSECDRLIRSVHSKATLDGKDYLLNNLSSNNLVDKLLVNLKHCLPEGDFDEFKDLFSDGLPNVTDYPSLNNQIQQIAIKTMQYVKKHKENLQIKVSDRKNDLYNSSYDLKNKIDSLFDMVNDVYVPNIKRFNNLQYKVELLRNVHDKINNATDSRITTEENSKLNNIANVLKNNQNDLAVHQKTLQTNISERLNLIRKLRENKIVGHEEYYDDLGYYLILTQIVVCVLRTLKSVCIALSVINAGKANEYTGIGTFNEDILKFSIDTDFHSMEKLVVQYDSLIKLRMKMDQLMQNFDNCKEICKNKEKLYFTYKDGVVNSFPKDKSDTITKMCVGNLLQKHLSKIQIGLDDQTKGKNIRRLYHLELKNKNDKMFEISKYTNKVGNLKHRFTSVQICYNNISNLIDQWDGLFAGSFKFMIGELMAKYLIMQSSCDAHELLGSRCNTPVFRELIETYEDVWKMLMGANIYKLQKETFNNFADLADKVIQMIRDDIENADTGVQNCINMQAVNRDSIVNTATGIKNSYEIILNPDIGDPTNHTIIDDLIAMEYV